MPRLLVCPKCGELTPTKPCRQCRATLERQRNAKPHRIAHRSPRHARLRRATLKRDGYECVLCGATQDLTLDYLTPLQTGGTQTLTNTRTLCRSCNSRRRATQPKARARDQRNDAAKKTARRSG